MKLELARKQIKATLRKKGYTISSIAPDEITRMAKELVKVSKSRKVR